MMIGHRCVAISYVMILSLNKVNKLIALTIATLVGFLFVGLPTFRKAALLSSDQGTDLAIEKHPIYLP